ncbi:hypothetical protein BT93_L2778 [Corymbia citriodora subsp. variegata]|uniref:Uncharacterized protein n=1 Tax=Corymbia citriodora subsp. variegata TaxID=360336 RepID=A0A8T0CP60_CORYI|nr:hypothetical protein BT93_L2778 [Corymbia citriodora subsp. variegata]
MKILFCSDNDVRNLIPISEMVRQQRFSMTRFCTSLNC